VSPTRRPPIRSGKVPRSPAAEARRRLAACSPARPRAAPASRDEPRRGCALDPCPGAAAGQTARGRAGGARSARRGSSCGRARGGVSPRQGPPPDRGGPIRGATRLHRRATRRAAAALFGHGRRGLPWPSGSAAASGLGARGGGACPPTRRVAHSGARRLSPHGRTGLGSPCWACCDYQGLFTQGARENAVTATGSGTSRHQNKTGNRSKSRAHPRGRYQAVPADVQEVDAAPSASPPPTASPTR